MRLSDSESQFISLYKLFKETERVKPVTILAASCCIFSRVSLSYSVHPSQTTEAYSKIGLRNDVIECFSFYGKFKFTHHG